MVLNQIIKTLREAESVVILPHIMADGDSLGASIAFARALKSTGIEALVLLEEEIPNLYAFLPGRELTAVYSGQAVSADAAVALDTGDIQRLGRRYPVFEAAKTTINIDHHKTNSGFGRINHVDVLSSSVGEIVYQLINLMGVEVDRDMALCLYVAIATDTGGFRYANTTSKTHIIAADLLNIGINVARVSQRVFDTVSVAKVKLMGAAINSLEILEKGKVAFVTITDDDIKRAGALEEDCEGLVNIARNVEGVEVAALFREKRDGEIKVNLRSKEWVDVASIAEKFSGGGHKRAAGCSLRTSLKEAVQAVLNEIREALSHVR